MEKERNLYLDVLKAVSVILVVFGHSIQYGSGMEYLSWGYCLYNPVFSFIYSFHMPLFMLISGYLFYFSSKNKTAKELIVSKSKQILIPLFCWSFVSLFVHIIKILAGVSSHKITLVWIFQTIFSGFWGGPWFLWAIWWCSLLIIIGRKYFKDSLIFYSVVWVAMFFIPDTNNTAVYKFMLPFFILAYLFNKFDLTTKLSKIYLHKAFGFSALFAFLLLFPNYNFDSFIYTSGYYILDKNIVYQLHNDCFRFVIGLVGSIAVMCIVHAFMDACPHIVNKVTAYIGTCSLGIYLVSNYIFDEVLKYLPIPGLNYLYTIVETICILGVSLLVTRLLKKNKITNMLFLGGR